MEPPEVMCGALCLTCVTRAPPQWPTDFSIDRILRHAGPRPPPPPPSQQLYDWLHCTRYRPPKLHRSKKKEGCVRRKLGRNPRIPFSASQVAVLEDKFRISPYLSASDVSHLSTLLRLSDTRIKIWFQNRRARERRDHGKVDVLHQTPPSRQSSGPVKSAFTPTPQPEDRQHPTTPVDPRLSELSGTETTPGYRKLGRSNITDIRGNKRGLASFTNIIV